MASNAGVLGQLSDLLGAQTAALRLILSILLGYPLALIHRHFLFGKDAIQQHLFFTLTGLAIGYWNYDVTIFHSTTAVIVTYLVITLLRGSLGSVVISFIFNMGYLLYGYYMTNTEDYDIKWTMPQCVLTLRLIGLAFDVYDGKRNESELSANQKLTALRESPSFLETAAFAYFPGAFLVGPQFSLKRYRDYINGTLMDDIKTDNNGRRLPPDSLESALYRMILGFFYIAVYQIGIVFVSDQYLLDPAYRELNFFKKLFLLGFWGRITLYKYISCWLLSEGVCIAFGLTYNGKDKNGNLKWDGCANVKLFTFENATEFGHYISSFNTNTNNWCVEYIYKRVKFLGSRLYSQITVLLFLAIWHGFHSGYYMCFLMEFIIMYLEKEIKPFLLKLDFLKELYEKNTLFKISVWFLLKIYTFVFMGYSLIPFVMLTYTRYINLYTSVYFIGHIFFISLILLTPYIKKMLRPKRDNNSHQD